MTPRERALRIAYMLAQKTGLDFGFEAYSAISRDQGRAGREIAATVDAIEKEIADDRRDASVLRDAARMTGAKLEGGAS